MKLNIENFGILFDILLFMMLFVAFAFMVAEYFALLVFMVVCKIIFVVWFIFVVCFILATMIDDIKTGKGDMW
jgi:hypothetical protein